MKTTLFMVITMFRCIQIVILSFYKQDKMKEQNWKKNAHCRKCVLSTDFQIQNVTLNKYTDQKKKEKKNEPGTQTPKTSKIPICSMEKLCDQIYNSLYIQQYSQLVVGVWNTYIFDLWEPQCFSSNISLLHVGFFFLKKNQLQYHLLSTPL